MAMARARLNDQQVVRGCAVAEVITSHGSKGVKGKHG